MDAERQGKVQGLCAGNRRNRGGGQPGEAGDLGFQGPAPRRGSRGLGPRSDGFQPSVTLSGRLEAVAPWTRGESLERERAIP